MNDSPLQHQAKNEHEQSSMIATPKMVQWISMVQARRHKVSATITLVPSTPNQLPTVTGTKRPRQADLGSDHSKTTDDDSAEPEPCISMKEKSHDVDAFFDPAERIGKGGKLRRRCTACQ